jgi:type 1 glutamine amidotransferase
MKRILFLTGGPRFHPVEEQAQLVEGWLDAQHGAGVYECIRKPGLAAFEALDESVDLLAVMGLFWPGMSADWAGKMTYEPMTATHEAALARYVARGGPVLSHHGGIASYPECATFAAACGWAWVWETTTHSPFGRWTTRVVPGHPVTQGVESFEVNDEIYYRVKELEPGRTMVHATAAFEGQDHPMVSTIEAGGGLGRRVYLANGHDLRAMAPASMRALWLNSIRWCVEGK